MPSLGERFPEEQERCRELLTSYERLGPIGTFGATHIRLTLMNADKAFASGDIIQMIRIYKEMRMVE